MPVFIGIDPGAEGAIVVIGIEGSMNGPIEIEPTPMVGKELDLRGIYDILRRWNAAMVTIEKQQPMPMKFGGTIVNYRRGTAKVFAMACVALDLPYQEVHPKTWQKSILADVDRSDTKEASVLVAKRLFPRVSLKRTPRCKSDSDGISDALLLAEYGRRMHTGSSGK